MAFEQMRCISLGQSWCGSVYWLTVVNSLPPNLTTDIKIRSLTCDTSQRRALAVVHPNDAAISHLSARQCWSTASILMALQRLKSVLCFFFSFSFGHKAWPTTNTGSLSIRTVVFCFEGSETRCIPNTHHSHPSIPSLVPLRIRYSKPKSGSLLSCCRT